jgi:hypothetical protein
MECGSPLTISAMAWPNPPEPATPDPQQPPATRKPSQPGTLPTTNFPSGVYIDKSAMWWASFANAAQISVSYCEPWANRDAPAKMLK